MVSTPSLAPTFRCEARLPLINARLSANTTARGARRRAIYIVWGSLIFGGVKVCRWCFLWCRRVGVVTVVVPPGVVTVVVAPGVVTVVVPPGVVTVVVAPGVVTVVVAPEVVTVVLLGAVVVPPLVAVPHPLLQ